MEVGHPPPATKNLPLTLVGTRLASRKEQVAGRGALPPAPPTQPLVGRCGRLASAGGGVVAERTELHLPHDPLCRSEQDVTAVLLVICACMARGGGACWLGGHFHNIQA